MGIPEIGRGLTSLRGGLELGRFVYIRKKVIYLDCKSCSNYVNFPDSGLDKFYQRSYLIPVTTLISNQNTILK